MEIFEIDGLLLYQSILLCCGGIVFLTGILSLIVYLIRNLSITKPLTVIVVSILFIGFPGIKKFSFMKDVVSVETWTDEVAQNPSDSAAYKNLEDAVENLESRPVYSTEKLTVLAKGKTLSGNYSEGIKYADRAIQKNQNYIPARDVKSFAETSIAIENVVRNPDEREYKEQLNNRIPDLERQATGNTYLSLRLAEAYLIGGNPDKALEVSDRIYREDSRQTGALEIKKLAEIEIDLQYVQENPTDPVSRDNLNQRVREYENFSSSHSASSDNQMESRRFNTQSNVLRTHRDSTLSRVRNLR